jgi:signal transduction histidine kinase
LPRLVSGTATWQLPLNDHAAFELARLLVIDPLQEREELVAELMAVEPVVALWTACAAAAPRSGSGLEAPPRCVMDLARWLARHADHVLHWSAADVAAGEVLREHRARWRELVADAVAVANLAAEPVTQDDLAAEVFLLGLLHNATDWLRSCGPRVSIARRQAGCLPSWLVEFLRRRARPATEPMRHVGRAVRLWRESGRRGRHIEGVDLTEAALARRRWQAVGRTFTGGQHLLVALTERLQRLGQLEREFQHTLEQEKLAALGELAYGASHEINNPLANISTRAQTLMAQEKDPERRRTLATINTQAFRANEMIADMMLFARPPELQRQRVELVALVDDLIQELAEETRLQGTRLTRVGNASGPAVSADATQLSMALRAVLVNSLEAVGAAGEVLVTVDTLAARENESQDWARLAVRDTGPGIPPHVRRHLFDPFFSGREAGRGLGLGLAKCWRVVTMHGGRIEVCSAEHDGTTMTILLPLEAEEGDLH